MPQRHAIRRLIIEVTAPDAAMEKQIAPVISDFIQHQMTRLLEQSFDAATPANEMLCIDRLELDLGHLDHASLQHALAAQIEASLPMALEQARRARTQRMAEGRGGRPDADAGPLLLIGHFVATGALPWWSESRDREAIDRATQAALLGSPAALARTARGLSLNAAGMERWIAHLSDQTIARVVASLAPETETMQRDLKQLLETAPIVSILTPARRRLIVWRALLHAAACGTTPAFVENALTVLAEAGGTTLTVLLADLRAAAGDGGSLSIASQLSALIAKYDAIGGSHTGALEDAGLLALMDSLAPLAAHLSDGRQLAWAAALSALARTRRSGLTANHVAALLRPLADAQLITIAEEHSYLGPFEQRDAAASAASPPEAVEDDDSYVVASGGVCLLWPFLPRFFGRLGLLNAGETAFVSLTACHRAALLLHYLATDERDAPDYALLLPRALCGLTPSGPHYPVASITGAEAAEALQLLEAAIAHASCLGAISPDGFRGAFLVRDGILGVRDGAWLLRLERHAADILLDRLPWTMQWLKLPWMQAAMRVEW
jgi:hypothetical protein